MMYYGDFAEDATVYIIFNTFDSNDPSASVTITNLADADIKVHKDAGTTQIVTDGATIAINFDTITGNHIATIDTSAHADYATGSEYQVRIEGTTVDGATINAWIGCFSIERAGGALALIKAGNLSANVVQISGDSTAADNLELDYDGTGYTKANSTIGTCTTNTDMVAAAPTAASNADAVWDEALSGHVIAGSFGKAVADIETDVTLVLADTNELQTDWADAGRLDVILDARMAEASINTTGGAIDVVTLVTTTTTNTDMVAAAPTAAANADAVWDELLSGHVTVSTFGKAVADIETDATAILVDTGTTIPASISGLNDLSTSDVFTYVIENSETFEQQLRLMRSESAGMVSVSGNDVSFRDSADGKNRMVSTTDTTGQRTTIVLDLT